MTATIERTEIKTVTDKTLERLTALIELIQTLRDDGYSTVSMSLPGQLWIDFPEFQRLFKGMTAKRTLGNDCEYFERTLEGVVIKTHRSLPNQPSELVEI